MDDSQKSDAETPASPDDQAHQKFIVTQAFEQTCKLIDDPKFNLIQALFHTHEGRNKMVDQATKAHAKAGKAECRSGCSACCHQMVVCTPFEVLFIAGHILHSKSPEEIEVIKGKLSKLAPLPLNSNARYGVNMACALLENNQCSIYEKRPYICRTMLSASRAACEKAFFENTGTFPYIVDPTKLAELMQLGIDLALLRRTNVSTEKVELSRALLLALNDLETVLTQWVTGQNRFKDSQHKPNGSPSNREMAKAAAKHLMIS